MTGAPDAGKGRVADSLRALALRPGALTRAALDGRGADLVSPGTLLTLFAALFFVLTWVQQRHPAAPSADVAALCSDRAAAGSPLGALVGGEVGANGGTSAGATRALGFAEDVLCHPQRYTRAFAVAVPVGFLLLMPLSAALMLVAFGRQLPGFGANWGFAVEEHAALFLLLTALSLIALLGSLVVAFLASVAGLFYASWHLVAGVERVYRVSVRTATWRTTLVGIPYAVVLALVVAGLMWALLVRA